MKKLLLLAALLTLTPWSIGVLGQMPTATVFEGARLITGDGSAPIENAAFVVEGSRFTQVGRAGQIKAPAGAARVNLAGKTVIPGLIDTHTHMPETREALVDALQRGILRGQRRHESGHRSG